MLANMFFQVIFGNRCAQQIARLFFNAARYITHSLTFFNCLLIQIYPRKDTLRFPSFKENIIWTIALKRVATDFSQFFS